MSLVCPECKRLAFRIVDSVECGPSAIADETTIQRAFCPDCQTCFFCTYAAVRSFNPDREDRVTHLAFEANPVDWVRSAKVFDAPSRRVATRGYITAAMKVLRRSQRGGVIGRPITYSTDPVPYGPHRTHPVIVSDVSWLGAVLRLLRRRWSGTGRGLSPVNDRR